MAREKYDRYSDDFKLKVLSDYFERGMSKYFIARKWGINRGLIDAWLKIWPIDPKELSLPDEIISTSRMSDKGSAKSGERRECYVPNYEVSEELANAVEETGWTEVAKALEQSRYLLDATLRGDAATVARMVQDAHIDNTSLIKYSDENSMSCVLAIAYNYAHGDYIFHREYQSGKGFADLVLMPRKNGRSGVATESNAVVVEVKNFYDDYSCRQELSSLFSAWADSIYAQNHSLTVARGRQTATLCYTSDAKKYYEIYGYDEHGRIKYKLCAYSDKWMKIDHTTYNFIGDVVSVNENVYKHGDYNVKIVLAKRRTVNTYHPGTRLLASTTVTHIDKNGNTSTQVVSSPTYDFLGNVTADNRPGTAADMAYTYDMLHGWLSGISSPCGFSEQLQRETATNALFSGNIGSMQWQNTANGEQHKYDFTYDSLGRLTSSLYSSSANGTSGRFDETVSYNPNGSITLLMRNGMKNDGTFGLIDSLAITYDGNRLVKVTDDAEALNYNGALDFNDGDDATCEYDYDSNGALTRDSNRGINSITYDYGHHTYKINLDRNNRPRNITNDYTTDGRKLLSKHVMSIPHANGYTRKTTTDLYVDGLMLRGGTPLLWQFAGGYVDLNANGAPTCWNYYVTDHLGSTRMVVSSNDSIKETINYYPFGSEMQMQDPALLTGGTSHPFRFTGKELDRLNALNMYDFGARWYDVAGVPMWTSIDPLCEKYYNISPYAYCGNNPVKYIDEQGDSLSLSGNEDDVNSTIDVYNKGMGGYYQVSVDKNGLVSLNANSSFNPVNMTDKEKAIYGQLNHAINTQYMTNINIVNNSSEVIIGRAKTATIDIGDINAMSDCKNSSPVAALMHETNEQSLLQNPNYRPTDKFRIIKAHGAAEGLEHSYTGNIGVTNILNINNNSGFLEFHRDNIILERKRIINGNFK